MEKRVNYLSLISVVSSLAVVMLHTNGCFWIFSRERYWATANIIESVMYYAVPLFFMTSGATLIDYRDRYSTKTYFKKRIDKVFIPFIAWSIIGVVYRVIVGNYQLEFSISGIKNLILDLLNTNIVEIYWFFIPLFSIYLSIPLLAAVERDSREKVFMFLICTGLFFNQIIPFICSVFNINYNSKIEVRVAGGYLIFLLLGYVLNKRVPAFKTRLLIYIMGIIGLIMHIVGTYVLSMKSGTIINLYKGYTNVPCVLYSIAMFVFLQQVGERIKNEKVIKCLDFLGKYTFPVYLMHWFVMDIIKRLFDVNIYSIVYRVATPFVIYAICIGITWCVRKIPVLRRILP